MQLLESACLIDGDDHDGDTGRGGVGQDLITTLLQVPILIFLIFLVFTMLIIFLILCFSTVESSAGNVFRVAAASGLILAKTHR